MNRVYTLKLAVCLCLIVTLPRFTNAQCGFCSGGAPATAIVQTVPVGPSNSSSATINFNKFYDPTGQTMLTCFSFTDTISAVSTSSARNEDPDSLVYTFKTDVNYTIKGPVGGGLNITEDSVIIYGPDTLAPFNWPGDSVVNGPDTFFNQKISNSLNNTHVTPYTGSAGTIGLSITFGGGGTAIGGSNYTYNIKTQYWGVFKLTYYICPSVALATSITNFTASQQGSTVLLQWIIQNPLNDNRYEVEISTDGKTFHKAGDPEASPFTESLATKYEYRYDLAQVNVGKVYFRVKQIDANNRVSYSAILTVHPNGGGDEAVSYQTYPNPVTNSLTFRFNSVRTGQYRIELVNTAGQTVQQKTVTLTGASEIPMSLVSKPSKGLYFVRVADLTHDQRWTTKVLIN